MSRPFEIPKRLVFQAYQRVKRNKGAAGVDGITIDMFEQDLKRNLYKIWNRMSSGSYHPQPVKQVAIPKANGGERLLGIPTVADRIAQTTVQLLLEPRGRSAFPSRFIRISSGKIRPRCPGSRPKAMLAQRLVHRPGHKRFL